MQAKSDPCDETIYKQLPYEGNRILNNLINVANGDKILSDRELPKDWYRASEEMPTTPPPLYSCGTIFPIWFDGEHKYFMTKINDLSVSCNAILII